MARADALIAALVRAHDTGTRIIPAMAGLSRADGLRIQSAVMARLGKVAGFKVGQMADGRRPILAPIPQRYVVAHGGTRRVPDRLGVELEVGFELVKPLPGNTSPTTQAHFSALWSRWNLWTRA